MAAEQTGRPPIFESPDQLAKMVDNYFEGIERNNLGVENKIRPTITGLCLFLGFESRQSFYDYEKNEEFSYTIRRSRMRIEQIYENALFTNPPGAIFALKNFGWSDKSELDVTTGGEALSFTLNVKPDQE